MFKDYALASVISVFNDNLAKIIFCLFFCLSLSLSLSFCLSHTELGVVVILNNV